MKKLLIRIITMSMLLFNFAFSASRSVCAEETEIRLFQDMTDLDSKYFNPVYWAKCSGITAGYTSNGTISFRPEITCTRANYTIMLWRFSDSPSSNISNPYTDVNYSQSTATYQSIMWAAQQGYSVGYPDHTFRPENSITRKDAVIMLWRLEGKPLVSTTMFSDVNASPNSDTYKAIAWAKYNSIVNGYSDGTFRPDNAMIRGDVAIVLYKYALFKNSIASSILSMINAYRAEADYAPDTSTGLSKYVSLSPGIEIDNTNTLYEYPNTTSSQFPGGSTYYFQNYAFGYTHDDETPIALMAFNNSNELSPTDILVAWDMESNSEYAVLNNIDFDHGNAVAFNTETNIFSVSTGTGDQKAIINYKDENGGIIEVSRNPLTSHMSQYDPDYVTSGVVYLVFLNNSSGYIAQYVVPNSDDRMFAWYEDYSSEPYAVDSINYRHHSYDYTGQSMYTVQVGNKRYLGFIYMTRSYYEESGTVYSFLQGKADLYDLDTMQYVGTQWFDPIPREIESASVCEGNLYIAYSTANKVYYYKADYIN